MCFSIFYVVPVVAAVRRRGGSAAPPKGQPANFNPDISLILSGTATHLSNDPDNYAIAGFILGADTGPGTRGLSLVNPS